MNPDFYENRAAAEHVESEASVEGGKRVTKIELSDGIRLWIEGHPYPYVGAATAEAIFAINTAKKMLIELPKIAFLTPRKTLHYFATIAWSVVSPHILKAAYMTPAARELRVFIYNFLEATGWNIEISTRTVDKKPLPAILSHIIELDAAYRIRMQDLFGETSKIGLRRHPVREIWRLVEINRRRDYRGVHLKIRKLAWFLTFALMWPPVRKSFKEAITQSNFSAFQPDDGDRYWADKRTDYSSRA